jgi:hypothetical protein
MNAERHYDDESLIALMEANRDASDSHLPGCETCTEKLESVRMIAEALKDEMVWTESSAGALHNRDTARSGDADGRRRRTGRDRRARTAGRTA